MFLNTLLLIFIVSYSYAGMYTVQKNDSLWKIAKNHGITITDIRKLNDLYGEFVYEKQRLYIPSSITTYTAKNGDTFQSIATQFNTKIQYLITLNNLSENHIIEGQKLRIPISEKTTNTPIQIAKTDPIIYQVKRGDTLSDVALKYKTTVPKLQELNNKKSSSIYVGEKLIVGNREVPQISKDLNKTTYRVKSGDTLGQIALDHGVSSKAIMQWNNKKSANVYVNEQLTIYTAKKTTDTTNHKTIQYAVRRGENLSYIAAKFGTTATDIKKLNNKDSDRLLIGENLTISVKVTKDTEKKATNKDQKTRLIRYKVKRGDTLDGIALKYKVQRNQLLSWNNKRTTRIYIGESLKIHVIDSPTPQASKKAEYIKKKSGLGIKSNRFKDVPLPVKYANIVSASTSGRGVDLLLDKKTTLTSPSDAKVQYAGYINALQNVVILDLSEDRAVVYAGLDRLNVKTGQEIPTGHLLGSTGMNNIDKKPKLYIEMRDKNQVVNVLHSYTELTKKQK
ncbi:MAG: LysM peptidoglycan-binding domain-containing protein [Brevinema sp.]